MEQLFRQVTLSLCRQNASITRSSKSNLSDNADDNVTCEEAANEMLEWRYAVTESLRLYTLHFQQLVITRVFREFLKSGQSH